MSDYKDIKGLKVRYLASDPANPELGEVWYNSTTNVAKVRGYQSAAWASGGNMPYAGYTNAGAGTLTAGLSWGGVFPVVSTTAEYDGSAWTTGGSYPVAIANHGGTGSQTAALSVTGMNPASQPARTDAFEYDGTSWGSPTSVGRQGFGMRVLGTQTSAVATGGGPFPAPTTYNTTDTELYDGSTWTAGNAFSTERSFHSTGGVNQTSGIVVGGRSAPGQETAIDLVEEYDGTSWTSGTAHPTVVKECSGWGAANDFIQAGGSVPAATANCAIYDGSTWTSTASMPAVRSLNATSMGTYNTNTGMTFGGSPPTLNTTLEFNGAAEATLTIGTS